jgi:hypothetical protein
MLTAQILQTHMVAVEVGRPPFFFSRFNFARMKERGNTHYCFRCGGPVGFIPGPKGEATNCKDGEYNPMKDHDPITHADAVITRANCYSNVWEWLDKEIARKCNQTRMAKILRRAPKDFPFIVSVPQV